VWLDAFYHSLNPVALSLGPLSIRWYGLAYLVGFVLAGVVMYRTAQRWKLNVTPDDVLNLMVGISFGVIVGARLFYVIFYGAGYYVAHPLDAFALSQGGMSFHGGLKALTNNIKGCIQKVTINGHVSSYSNSLKRVRAHNLQQEYPTQNSKLISSPIQLARKDVQLMHL